MSYCLFFVTAANSYLSLFRVSAPQIIWSSNFSVLEPTMNCIQSCQPSGLFIHNLNMLTSLDVFEKYVFGHLILFVKICHGILPTLYRVETSVTM